MTLSWCNIHSFDKISLCKNIEYLNLCNNKIKLLPDDIINLIKIKYLIVSNNLIIEISDNLSQLENLEYLDLSSNQIEKLPDLSSLTKLKYLNLSYNTIIRSEQERIKKSLPNCKIIF